MSVSDGRIGRQEGGLDVLERALFRVLIMVNTFRTGQLEEGLARHVFEDVPGLKEGRLSSLLKGGSVEEFGELRESGGIGKGSQAGLLMASLGAWTRLVACTPHWRGVAMELAMRLLLKSQWLIEELLQERKDELPHEALVEVSDGLEMVQEALTRALSKKDELGGQHPARFELKVQDVERLQVLLMVNTFRGGVSDARGLARLVFWNVPGLGKGRLDSLISGERLMEFSELLGVPDIGPKALDGLQKKASWSLFSTNLTIARRRRCEAVELSMELLLRVRWCVEELVSQGKPGMPGYEALVEASQWLEMAQGALVRAQEKLTKASKGVALK